MVFDDLELRKTIPTEPEQHRPPKFGAITQLVKDAFVLELRRFFNNTTRTRIGELLNIEKYAVSVDAHEDPLATALNLFRAYPQTLERLPMVAVLAASGTNLKLGLSRKFVCVVQHPPKIVGARSGPFSFLPDDFLVVETWPGGVAARESRFVFTPPYFVDPSVATLQEVIKCFDYQSHHLTAKRGWEGDHERLALAAGSDRVPSAPNSIRIVDGSQNALDTLGLTIGQTKRSDDPDQRIMHRHYVAANLTIQLEIATESEHQRTEITDLVYDFLAFTMGDRQFTMLGRGIFDERISGEIYQIIIKDAEIAVSGDQEVPRDNDPYDKIFISRVSVPVTAIQYIDRVLVDEQGQPIVPTWRPLVGYDDDLNSADRPYGWRP